MSGTMAKSSRLTPNATKDATEMATICTIKDGRPQREFVVAYVTISPVNRALGGHFM